MDLTEPVLSLTMEGHVKLQFGDAMGLLVCVGTRSCAVSCLFIWPCLNPEQDVLGNHSGLDKQQFVTLALFFSVSVIVTVRKAQAVERWVKAKGKTTAGKSSS